MAYRDWKIGDKVVCLKGPREASRVKGANYVEKGQEYTIRQIRNDAQPDGHLTLLVEEVDNSHLIGMSANGQHAYLEPGFPISGFQKVLA